MSAHSSVSRVLTHVQMATWLRAFDVMLAIRQEIASHAHSHSNEHTHVHTHTHTLTSVNPSTGELAMSVSTGVMIIDVASASIKANLTGPAFACVVLDLSSHADALGCALTRVDAARSRAMSTATTICTAS